MTTIKAQLHLLYHAGKKSLPADAMRLADTLQSIGDVHEAWRAPTIYAGSPPALADAMAINAEVYQLLRRAVLSYQDAAHAVVSIADDFARTDSDAAGVIADVGFTLDTVTMPHLPEPPTLGEAER